MEKDFDIIVIGSGPGGYVAAIRAAQLGFKTAIIEKYDVLGGTCTVVGCIPSKALLDASEHLYAINHKMKKMGIHAGNVHLDFTRFIERKSEVVKSNTDGIAWLMRSNKVTTFFGTASFVNDTQITLKATGRQDRTLKADYFIVATGSKPSSLPGVPIDKIRIITSTEALSLHERPSSMVIIGGGVIGVEMASIYHRIGTKVTILEYAGTLIPSMDNELGKALEKSLTKDGITVMLNCKVQSAKNNGDNTTVGWLDSSGTLKEINADYCLLAVGRKPYTGGLGLEKAGIQTDTQGRIITGKGMRTNIPSVFAVGDVVAGPMLAHKAEDEGIVVAETIKGLQAHLNYQLIPSVVYTWPEVAGAGYTEQQLKEKNIPYRLGKFPFLASGRARAAEDTEGFVKVLADPKYGEVLGVHIIGARAADLIQQAVVAMEFEITDTEMGRITYPHPTYSEVLKDAFRESCGCGAINI